MKHGLALSLLTFLVPLAGVQQASAAAVAIDTAYREEAQSILTDLDHHLARFSAFAAGTNEPLLYGRSLPVPPQTCAATAEPRLFGLLIGAETPGPKLLEVPAALNDAALMSSMLADAGAAADDIHVLTGDKATRQGVVEATWSILSELSCEDKVIVYFGGQALRRETVHDVAVKPNDPGPGGRDLGRVIDDSRKFLSKKDTETHAPELALSIRRKADLLGWADSAGIVIALNGQGVYDSSGPSLSSFEVLTPADLSELVTLLRNHRADVSVVIDTDGASRTELISQQQSVAAGYWSAEVSKGGPAAHDSRLRPTRLVGTPGDLAVFYSSVGDGRSVSASFDIDGEQVRYGLFTFRVVQAMVGGRNLTVRNIHEALDRIVKADASQSRVQAHLIEATRPEMSLFGRGEGGGKRTDTIRIIEPSGMRGASVFDNPQIDLVGVVDWRAPAKAVLVEGQPATLTRDGRFAASVRLNAGLNTISVTALTSDDEIHVMPPLEVMFDGDLEKLKGEGRRYALIIANQDYLPETRFSRLQTPIADAEALSSILTSRYGFKTELSMGDDRSMPLLLVNATKEQIEETLYTLSQVAGEQDTVLIYYAGHGVYDERTTNAYWVPVDATRPYNYLSGDAITEHIQRIMARSVVLISDSCYSGALRSGGEAAPPVAGVTDEDRQRALLRMAEGRSRILITSGGTEPVMDTGGGGHSIFARALLTGLEAIDRDAFAAEELYRDYIRPMVSGRVEQMPQYKPIEKTGHEPAADVVFVRAGG